MTYALISVPSFLVLVLLYALLVGQPAARETSEARIATLATENAYLRAHQAPTATPYAKYCLSMQFC